MDEDKLRANEVVADVRRITEPYKKANRRFHPLDTHVAVAGRTIGEGFFHVMAGPCSVESEAQLCTVAESVKKSGATFLRGGAVQARAPLPTPSRAWRRAGWTSCARRGG